MKESITFGAVFLRNHKWTFSYFVDGNRVTCPDDFRTAGLALAAMKKLVKNAQQETV